MYGVCYENEIISQVDSNKDDIIIKAREPVPIRTLTCCNSLTKGVKATVMVVEPALKLTF